MGTIERFTLTGTPAVPAYRELVAFRIAFVLPIELAWILVSHLEGCTRCMKFLCKHLLPCCMESELFLKLKRAHPCQTAKVMMQSRSAHSRQRCKLIYIKRLLEVFTQPSGRLSRSIASVCQSCNRTQTISSSLGESRRHKRTFLNLELARGTVR
jgi:hypothetical protein